MNTPMVGENQKKSGPTSQPATPDEDAGEVLEWTCPPVKRRPLVSVLATSFVLLVSAMVHYATGSAGFALLALIILLASLAKFYFPTTYRLTDRRIVVKTTTQTLDKEWSVYRSYYRDKNGILLSPFAEPSRLENFRGLYIMFAGNGDAVTAFVKKRLGGGDSTLENTTGSEGT